MKPRWTISEHESRAKELRALIEDTRAFEKQLFIAFPQSDPVCVAFRKLRKQFEIARSRLDDLLGADYTGPDLYYVDPEPKKQE